MTEKQIQLSDWLKQRRPDYNKGLALMLSYTNKPALYEQLSRYKNEAMLKQVLAKVLDEDKNRQQVKQAVMARVEKQVATENERQPLAMPQRSGDKVTEQLHREWIVLLKEIEDAKQKLFFIGRDAVTGKPKARMTDEEKEQRRQLAKVLVGKGGLNEQCLVNRDSLQYYQIFNRLPERVSKTEVNPSSAGTDNYRERENTRKLIGKLKVKIESSAPDNKKLPEWRQKLLEAEARMDVLKQANGK